MSLGPRWSRDNPSARRRPDGGLRSLVSGMHVQQTRAGRHRFAGASKTLR